MNISYNNKQAPNKNKGCLIAGLAVCGFLFQSMFSCFILSAVFGNNDKEKSDSLQSEIVATTTITTKQTFLTTTISSTVHTLKSMNTSKTTDNVTTATSVVSTNETHSDNQNLDDFLMNITPETEKSEILKIAKNFHLHSNYKNTGTGRHIYRFAIKESVADVNKTVKGSHITITFNVLRDDAIEEITYFNENTMIAGFWTPSDSYTLIDHNNPQLVTDNGKGYKTSHLPVDSFSEIVNYQAPILNEDNKLEELFKLISDEMTFDEISEFIKENNLEYNGRGVGNYHYVTYADNVEQKYGDSGTHIKIDFNSDDMITSMTYVDYPIYYKTGYYAVYYSENYPYSDLVGFYLVSGEETTLVEDANTLINELKQKNVFQTPTFTVTTTKSTPVATTVPTTTISTTTTQPVVTTVVYTEPPTISPTSPPVIRNEIRTVYYTETGSKYHYDSQCGRGTYYPCTIDEAIGMGLEPCKKCT